jgi:thymidine phosphorylase
LKLWFSFAVEMLMTAGIAAEALKGQDLAARALSGSSAMECFTGWSTSGPHDFTDRLGTIWPRHR